MEIKVTSPQEKSHYAKAESYAIKIISVLEKALSNCSYGKDEYFVQADFEGLDEVFIPDALDLIRKLYSKAGWRFVELESKTQYVREGRTKCFILTLRR